MTCLTETEIVLRFGVSARSSAEAAPVDYNVTIEFDSTASDDETTGRILDALRGYSPAIGWLPDSGRMDVTITLDATGLPDATVHGVALIQDAAQARPVRVEAMSTADFDAR